jgi:hypothetical protein
MGAFIDAAAYSEAGVAGRETTGSPARRLHTERGVSQSEKKNTHPPWRVRHTVGKGSRPQAKHAHPRAAAAEASHYAALIPE